jgi:hypothetical protein
MLLMCFVRIVADLTSVLLVPYQMRRTQFRIRHMAEADGVSLRYDLDGTGLESR